MDMQVYDDASKLEKQLRAALTEQVQPCIGKDPLCPCQDGDACHYKDAGDTKALPIKPEQVQPAQGTAGAKMPCGAVVTNVYDAYEAGKKAALLQSNAEPAQGEPAKLWCETCEGSGQVYEESQAGIPGSGGNRKCPDCSGDGYITSTVFRTALLQSNAERVPLTPAQRVDIADACANLDYDDNFLGDLGKIIDLVEAAHGITKGQQ
jgi:hypothetical protein